jgi:hypothetical protein
MNDRELTDKVLEAIALRMKEGKLAEQLQQLEVQIQASANQKKQIEDVRRQFLQAQSGSMKAADTAKQQAAFVLSKVKELMDIADKAMGSAKEAEQYANLFKKIPDFDAQITTITATGEAISTAHREITKDIAIIRNRKDQLKREGINIPMDAQKAPSNVAI